MDAVKIASAIAKILKQIAELEAQIAGCDPTAGWRDAAGNWVNRLEYLRGQLAGLQNTLAGLEAQHAALTAGAGATGAAAEAAPSMLTRFGRVAARAGRGLVNVARWAVGKPPLALGTGIATVVGTAAIAAVAIGTTVAVSQIAGSRFGDAPVQPGISMQGDHPEAITGPGAGTQNSYAVFVLTENSGGTIWIGEEAYLQTLRACDTPYGGTCDSGVTYPPVPYRKVSDNFATFDEALNALCSSTTQHPGYWGNQAEGYGGSYWNDYACPA